MASQGCADGDPLQRFRGAAAPSSPPTTAPCTSLHHTTDSHSCGWRSPRSALGISNPHLCAYLPSRDQSCLPGSISMATKFPGIATLLSPMQRTPELYGVG